MKDKFAYLIKNTGLLFVSNFASKVLVFLLVPFYTSILSTAEYGTYDLIYTTVQLLSPILTLNIVDSVIRFSIANNREEQIISFSVGAKYTLISLVALLALLLVIHAINLSNEINEYTFQMVTLFFAYVSNNLICQFARGIDDIKGVAISGIIGTTIMIAFNLVFLLWLQMGLTGYFYAMTASLLVPAAFLFIRDKMWEYIHLRQKCIGFRNYEKEMLQYCLPLIFINLSWYINNVSDRYAVTWMCGIEENGIYSVAYKIPAILNAVQVVFIQAWQLSAIREYNSKDGEQFYEATYEGANIIITLLCSALIALTKILSRILFADEFYLAWRYVPVLLIYIVFNTLSGVIGGVFSASKDSSRLAWTGVVGAAVNIVLNVILVYLMGAMGAAVATVISSITIWAMRVSASTKHICLKLNYSNDFAKYIVLFVQAGLMIIVNDIKLSVVFQIMSLFLMGAFNYVGLRKLKKTSTRPLRVRASNSQKK